MQANETKLQKVIEGTVQYVVPLFQRAYSWDKKEWQTFWNDIVELSEMETPKSHFIGSIVSMPTTSLPEGVTKYLLIDGQQRLTTVFLLLCLIRDCAKEANNEKLAAEIQERFLVNKFSEDLDYFKLMPTQADRDIFIKYIQGEIVESESQISNGYNFFKRKLKQSEINLEAIKKVISTSFSVVSIVLDVDDNPYLVFESLNAKGRPLAQGDLIRNYFFMRVHVNEQTKTYNTYWYPMQEVLKDSLTEFIRHFLMKEGEIIKQNEVYYSLKEKVAAGNALNYLEELNKYSHHYEKLLNPTKEPDIPISKYLKRLNRIEVTTAYPLLLNCYNHYTQGKITNIEFAEVLELVENYLIRRFVCGIPTNQLNKIFPSISSQIFTKEHKAFIELLRNLLQSKGYPKDAEFKTRFVDARMYGGGDRAVKTKLMLETLEESYKHKEMVGIDEKFTIEHIMPQTLTAWWKEHLGGNWQDIHELFVHNIGNLTLTAYNSELSNDTFDIKRTKLQESHLELNKYFATQNVWNQDEIESRASKLATIAISVWKYFGSEKENIATTVTGTTPLELKIMGEKFIVASWRDVLEQMLNTVAYLEPQKFVAIAEKYPRYLGKDKANFRTTRNLKNGYFVEVNLSAKDIQRLCNQFAQEIELTNDDWLITYKN